MIYLNTKIDIQECIKNNLPKKIKLYFIYLFYICSIIRIIIGLII